MRGRRRGGGIKRGPQAQRQSDTGYVGLNDMDTYADSSNVPVAFGFFVKNSIHLKTAGQQPLSWE